MKHNAHRLFRSLVALLLATGWAAPILAAQSAGGHPPLSEQDQYIACDQCHAETTPELHKEWFDSRHGVAMVKCYQCHGTFETFRVTPQPQDCAACHENMMHKCPQDKPCWQCHVPHSFNKK
ncbi:hypothetical protein Despr_1378 [Desulfobulbus propionicus DSM 2032]|uniref:Class III cytochrome C domain-containing protein n=1 Tax=Desulfobulbus propionicus (strain ATCC 33891 / DSM 2032 / VKM B-1956 / 1pr3) TaxID=577650 RepID=A0A7U3YLD9_DESPD|nr:cytochrome c3 family protein [Desulfobulbus propionicus]ADW17541.1 hypothetical protein Despr_1378 [Desulfobulbus propionicus DSM 2032]